MTAALVPSAACAPAAAPSAQRRSRWAAAYLGTLGALLLAACASAPPSAPAPTSPPEPPAPVSSDTRPGAPGAPEPAATPSPPSAELPRTLPAGVHDIARPLGRWQAVPWADLPGWLDDDLTDAWAAWVRSCSRATPTWQALCPELRALSLADDTQRRAWLIEHLQPYRVLHADGRDQGLLTAYFEPEFAARRERSPGFEAPLYAPPPGVDGRQPWFSRGQIDTDPAAQQALAGRALAWLADPLDALLLQIQGSGRLRITEPDGRTSTVRLAFAGHNGHPYQSIGRWLLDQGALRDASWPGLRAWLLQNPEQQNAVLARNPRVVFFREEALDDPDAGPRGAQGVALTPGRSVAVDPRAIPYGTPLWLVSSGPTADLRRLVLAQDTGNAITGAVRADYFAGWGAAAAELAGRLKQPLQLWVLWPR